MRTLRLAPFVVGAALLAVAAFAQPPAEKADLLNFAKGDLPNDTGSDKKTHSLADQPDLGQCLKVEFPFVADNGIDWVVSVAPDPRIPVMNEELRKVKGSDFEVVTPPAGYKQPG